MAWTALDPNASVSGIPDQTPDRGALHARLSPNPTAGLSVFKLDLPIAGQVNIDLFDLSGRKVNTLFSGRRESGLQAIQVDFSSERGVRPPNGIYFYKVTTASGTASGRVVLVN